MGRRVLGAVERWSIEWRAIFNPSKCQPMMISRQRGEPLPILMLHGSPLVWVDRLQYLGVWFDPTLSWSVHIDMVLRQALDRLRAIHRGVGTLWGLHPMIVSRMIVVVVLPALFYVAPDMVWGCETPGSVASIGSGFALVWYVHSWPFTHMCRETLLTQSQGCFWLSSSFVLWWSSFTCASLPMTGTYGWD